MTAQITMEPIVLLAKPKKASAKIYQVIVSSQQGARTGYLQLVCKALLNKWDPSDSAHLFN
jgi:hypothetical protein